MRRIDLLLCFVISRTRRRAHGSVVLGLCALLGAGLSGCADTVLEPEQDSIAAPAPPSGAVLDGVQCSEPGATLPSGAPYQVCVRPGDWNGHLLVFLPGYRNPAYGPATFDEEIGGLSAPAVVMGFGHAWATTSFCCTGLIEPDTWLADVLALVSTARTLLYESTGRGVDRVFVAGGSQGGLATVLAVERFPGVFTGGGLAACGPIGDYELQLRYVGDARVIFDALFSRVIPGWPVWRQSLPDDPGRVDPAFWTATAQSAVAAALQARQDLAGYWLGVTGAPVHAGDPAATTVQTVKGLLGYSFAGTDDAILKLNGMAYANLDRVYSGSGSASVDRQLNHARNGVQRFQFTAEPARVATLQTAGRVRRALVTMHTKGDEIVPVQQQDLYRDKTSRDFISYLLHNRITIDRYGHCNFTVEEVLGAYALLVLKSTGQNLF